MQLTCCKILSDDAACATIDNDELFHLITGQELHLSLFHLTAQRRVGTEQQLLARLSLGVECTAYLGTAERAVGQHAAILACEGYTLCHALVDDIVRHLSQTIDVGLAGTIVAALHGVVEQTIDRVSVVLIAFCCIDTTLCSDGVCASGRVLNAEVDHVEAHLGERSGCRCTGQTRTDDDDVELQLVLRVHQSLVGFIFFPFLGHRALRNLGI